MLGGINAKARSIFWVSIWLILLGLSRSDWGVGSGDAQSISAPKSYFTEPLKQSRDLAHTVFDTPIHSLGIYATKSEHLSKEDSKLKKHSKELLCGWRFDGLHQPPLSRLFSRHSTPTQGVLYTLSYLCRLNI